MKKIVIIFFLTLFSGVIFAQTDSSFRQKVRPPAARNPESTTVQKPASPVIRKPRVIAKPGTIKPGMAISAHRDSAGARTTVIQRQRMVPGPGTTVSRRDSAGTRTTVIQRPQRVVPRPGIIVPRRDSARMSDSLWKRSLVADSVRKRDSVAKIRLLDSLKQDSVKQVAARALADKIRRDTATYRAIMPIPYLPFNKPPLFMVIKEKIPQSKDELFYLLCGLVFMVAFIRLVFPKYFNNLFLLLFQSSFRQKQTREQLMQDNLASLLMNLVFIASGGIYFEFILIQNGLTGISFWWLLLYSTVLLVIVYLGKYLFLLFAGWIFNEKVAARTYIFVVFLVNKIIGIVLIPFLLILAFSSQDIVQVAITVSLFVLGILILYRYLVSLGTLRSELKVSPLHFFLYLCAVEILPLLLIYKALFNYVVENAI